MAGLLDELGVAWAVGGSFASSLYAEPRATNDVDIVAVLLPSHARAIVDALGTDFYVDEAAIRQAITDRRSFNVIDERTFVKVDVFVPASGLLGSHQLDRRRRLDVTDELHVWVLGPEDTILQKLAWHRLSGGASDRQWRDVVSVLRLNAGELDDAYLDEVAGQVDLDELLRRARADADIGS